MQDTPLPIGYGETISAPHMHATCLELLRGHLRPGARVLDVGSGSGYLSAAMGLMVRDKGGFVLGVEKHPELVEESLANVRHATPELLNTGTVEARTTGQRRCRRRGRAAGRRRLQYIAVLAAARLPALSARRVCPPPPPSSRSCVLATYWATCWNRRTTLTPSMWEQVGRKEGL